MKKLIVFDLDGTLLYTVRSITRHLGKSFANHGLAPLTEEEVIPILGWSSQYLVWQGLEQKGGGDRSEAEKKEILDEYNHSYLQDPIPLTLKYPGIDQLLEQLKDKGLMLAVHSNKPDAIVKKIIDHFFPQKPFTIVRGFLENVPKKPDPTSLFQMMKEIGVGTEEVIYVGDSEVDAKIAEAAGVDYILVSYGFRTEKALASFKPLHLCPDTQAVYKTIEKSLAEA